MAKDIYEEKTEFFRAGRGKQVSRDMINVGDVNRYTSVTQSKLNLKLSLVNDYLGGNTIFGTAVEYCQFEQLKIKGLAREDELKALTAENPAQVFKKDKEQ